MKIANLAGALTCLTLLGAAGAAHAGDKARQVIGATANIGGALLDAAAQHQFDLAVAANDRGKALYRSGDHAGAADAFRESLSHFDDPGVRNNLAKAEYEARRDALWKQAQAETDEEDAQRQAGLNAATAAEFDQLTAPR